MCLLRVFEGYHYFDDFQWLLHNKMEVVYIITLELLTAQLLIYFNRLFLLD